MNPIELLVKARALCSPTFRDSLWCLRNGYEPHSKYLTDPEWEPVRQLIMRVVGPSVWCNLGNLPLERELALYDELIYVLQQEQL